MTGRRSGCGSQSGSARQAAAQRLTHAHSHVPCWLLSSRRAPGRCGCWLTSLTHGGGERARINVASLRCAAARAGRGRLRRAAGFRPGSGRMLRGLGSSRSSSARTASRCTASLSSSPETRPSHGIQTQVLRQLREARSDLLSRPKSRRRRCRKVPAMRGSGALRSALLQST